MQLEIRVDDKFFSVTLEDWKVCTGKTGAKNHAVCSGAEIIVQVTPTGYPSAKGWGPISEAYAHLVASVPALLKACHMSLTREEGWEKACQAALTLPKITKNRGKKAECKNAM